MCACAWQKTAPHGGVSGAIASALPAMPLRIGNTSTSASKISPHCRRTRAVISSPPYDVIAPAFARTTASRISGAAGRTLSERKSRFTRASYHVAPGAECCVLSAELLAADRLSTQHAALRTVECRVLMCGVIGFISEAHRDDLGVVAAELLKTLEYRGYDSTGAAVQGET